MTCNYCNGDEAVFWKDDANCAFVDSHGEMMVVAKDKTMRFKVNRCPMCGRLLNSKNSIDLRFGDELWYVCLTDNIVEHCKVVSVTIKDDKVDFFTVTFDCENVEGFCGETLGLHFFLSKIDAENKLASSAKEFAANNEGHSKNHNHLRVGDQIWYVDIDSDECNIEHAKVEHVGLENDSVEWFIAKFDNGDMEEFGPNALDIYCFKSEAAARKAWEEKHKT